MNRKTLKTISNIVSLDAAIHGIKCIQHSKLYHKLYNAATTFGLQTVYSDKYKKIKDNEKYADIYAGKRCFILGNGPSLNDIDFSRLENEVVFTANNLMFHQNFPKLHSNYHFCIDTGMFGEFNGETAEYSDVVYNKYKLLHDAKVPNLVIPVVEAERYVDMYHLDEMFNIIYIFQEPKLIDDARINFNLTKAITASTTVVHFAILVALYMGFTEIYLLGCDGTITSAPEKITEHCYNTTNEEIENHIRINKQKNTNHQPILQSFECDLVYFKAFIYIYEYCTEHGISLINLSSKSIVPVIPKMNFNEIISQ